MGPRDLRAHRRRRSERTGLIDGVSTGEVAFVVHPTFLYELLWNVAIVVLLVLVDRKFAIGHGRLFALYVAGYCAGRFWIELMRADTATEIAGIRVNTFTSGIVFVLAVAYVIFARKGREAPETLNPGAVKAEVAAAGGAATGDEDARDNGTGTGGATAGRRSRRRTTRHRIRTSPIPPVRSKTAHPAPARGSSSDHTRFR